MSYRAIRKFFLLGLFTGCITILAQTGLDASVETHLLGKEEWNISVDHSLPAFKKGAKLLFQGDSITDMGRNKHANGRDLNHHLGHSFVFILAGRLGVELPDRELEVINRGISGNKTVDLQKRWQVDALDLQPDVLTLLVGINNVLLNQALETFDQDYRALLDASRKLNPDLKIVLLNPFILKTASFLNNEPRWNGTRKKTDSLRPLIAQIAKDYDAVHIKTQDIFDAAAAAVSPAYWLWDGIHPTAQGHELIARHWLKEVSTRWPEQ